MTDNVRTNVLAAFCRLCEGIDTQSGQTHRFVPTPIRRGGPVCPPDYYILRNGQTRRFVPTPSNSYGRTCVSARYNTCDRAMMWFSRAEARSAENKAQLQDEA